MKLRGEDEKKRPRVALPRKQDKFLDLDLDRRRREKKKQTNKERKLRLSSSLTEQNLAFPSSSIARDSLAVARSTSLSRVAMEDLSIERDEREAGFPAARSDDVDGAGVVAAVVVGGGSSSAAATTAASSPSAKLTFCFDFGRGCCDRLFGF